MKKIFALIIAMNLLTAASAQIVIDSKFKPFSYEEMAAPLMEMDRLHNECLNNLETLLDQTEMVEMYISKEDDPVAWYTYVSCYNSIVDVYKDINDHGVNSSTRRVISEKRQESKSMVNMIQSAYKRRYRLAREQYQYLRDNPGLTCSRFYSDMSLDEFLNGRTPEVTYQTQE